MRLPKGILTGMTRAGEESCIEGVHSVTLQRSKPNLTDCTTRASHFFFSLLCPHISSSLLFAMLSSSSLCYVLVSVPLLLCPGIRFIIWIQENRNVNRRDRGSNHFFRVQHCLSTSRTLLRFRKSSWRGLCFPWFFLTTKFC